MKKHAARSDEATPVSWFLWRTRDARGRWVRLQHVWKGPLTGQLTDREYDQLTQGLAQATSRDQLPATFLFPTGGTAVFAWLFFAPLVLIIGLAGAIVARVASRHAVKSHVPSELLKIGRCPSCFYRLSGLPCETADRIVCPECGAAWRLPSDLPSEESQSA